MNLSTILLEEASKLQNDLIKIRHDLHQCPGVGFDIEETKQYVRNQLTDMNINVEDCGKAGLIACIGKSTGKCFLLRADMDGLAIQEESDVDFKSLNGNMHACGHDMHTTMLLGAAKLLKQHEDEIEGTVKLMFQPAEETFQGSKDMIDHGVLDHPQVDGACMIHVSASLPIPEGTVLISAPGVSAPAADVFEIEIQGEGCHGSAPNTGIDPIIIASHIILALQEIQTRELPLSAQQVLTFGKFQAGTVENVIPDKAIIGGTIRTYDEEIREYIKQRMIEITQGLSASFRATSSLTFKSGCPTLVNDATLTHELHDYLKTLLGPHKAISVADMKKASPKQSGLKQKAGAGSEDFAYISHEVPSIMLALAAGTPSNGYIYPQHHPKVKFDESILSIGSAVYAYSALRWLQEHK